MYDFADRDHAANYLSGTVVRHLEDGPTYVHTIDYLNARKKLQVHHIPLTLMAQGTVKQSKIEEFDFKPFRLGMYNFTVDGVIVEAAWIQRYPARRWKVGLDRQGISVVPCRKAEDNAIFELIKDKRRVGAVSWWYNDDMLNLLEDRYPRFLEALDSMGKRTRCSVAFSRNFAVTGARELIYRFNAEPVGRVEGHIPVLFPAYQDLQEMLQEDLR